MDKGGTTKEWERLKKGEKIVAKSSLNVRMKSKKISSALTTNGNTIKEIKIRRSVGAAARNYSVKLLDSKGHTKLAENQKIKGKTFAGKGAKTEIRDRFRLESDYHIPADEWKKVSGKGYVIIDEKKRYAELHWYEADGEVYEMKIKRYLDES